MTRTIQSPQRNPARLAAGVPPRRTRLIRHDLGWTRAGAASAALKAFAAASSGESPADWRCIHASKL